MSEETGKGVRVGDYELEGRYHEVGPQLGRLHEAHNVRTGNPALVLLPGPGSTWKLAGPLSVRISCDPGSSFVRSSRTGWLLRTGLWFLASVGVGLALGYGLRQWGGL